MEIEVHLWTTACESRIKKNYSLQSIGKTLSALLAEKPTNKNAYFFSIYDTKVKTRIKLFGLKGATTAGMQDLSNKQI